MTRLLLVALGGALGSTLRYAATLAQQSIAAQRPALAAFPWATLLVNVVGSFVLGVVVAAAARGALSDDARVFLGVGVCGGFTTYSTYNAEALALLQQGATGRALLYVAVTLALGGAAGVAGLALGRA